MFINYGGDRSIYRRQKICDRKRTRAEYILENKIYIEKRISVISGNACILCRGELLERKMRGKEIRTYERFCVFQILSSGFEVDVDIAKTTLEAVDILFDEVEHHGCAEKVEKAKIGYCLVNMNGI